MARKYIDYPRYEIFGFTAQINIVEHRGGRFNYVYGIYAGPRLLAGGHGVRTYASEAQAHTSAAETVAEQIISMLYKKSFQEWLHHGNSKY